MHRNFLLCSYDMNENGAVTNNNLDANKHNEVHCLKQKLRFYELKKEGHHNNVMHNSGFV